MTDQTPRTEAGRALIALADSLDNPDMLTGQSLVVSTEFLREQVLAIEAEAATPTVVVKFSADATPEEVETAREQIGSLVALDEDRLARAMDAADPPVDGGDGDEDRAEHRAYAAAIARAYREDSE